MADPVFSSILVATDFSACSAVAVAQAIRIASKAGSAVRVVHVIDTIVVMELEAALSPMQKGIQDGLVSDAKSAWAEFARSIPGAASLPIEVVIDNRIVGLLRHAKDGRADLVVIGAFGEQTPDVGIGTVATACVRKSPVDVLIVRDTAPDRGNAPFQRIVVGIDFSPTSTRALERAAAFAASDGAELHVLHVFQPPWHRLHYRAPTPLAPVHLQKQYRDGLDRRLDDFCRNALAKNPGVRHRHVVHECPGLRSGIIEYAKSVHADLVVLGTHGRSNLKDVLLGSVAEKALRETHCSVLAVKPNPRDLSPA